MPKHPVFCSILKQINDDHQYLADPFGALAEVKIIIEKATRRPVRELTRKTPGSQAVDRLNRVTSL